MTDPTPGPWTTDGEIVRSDDEVICTVNDRWSEERRCGNHTPETRANARLIAAAPEMAGLIRELTDDLEIEVDQRYADYIEPGRPFSREAIHPAMVGKYDRDMEPVHRARAVLAKIEGGDP